MAEHAPLARPSTAEPAAVTDLMVATLERGLSRLRRRAVRIRGIQREFLGSSSSFRTERLRVALDGGKPLRVFFKDLNPHHQMEKARAVREFDLAPSRRELRVYQSILSPERFGTLRVYATRWEPRRGVYWIFLEDGGRIVLHNFLDLPRWTAAARWAARFHAATRDLSTARTHFLPRYDRAHYERCANRVREMLPDLDQHERELVGRGLEHYAHCIDSLSALPQSVIHGQFFGKNILLRRDNSGRRIAVIDWETAALGPGSFDLVSLTSGKWTRDERHAMRRAYFDAYQAETGAPRDWEAFCGELAVVTLYQALEWLAWWGHHRGLSRHFANFLKELERVLEEHFTAG